MRKKKKFSIMIFQIIMLSTLIIGNISITFNSMANNDGILLKNNILNEDLTTSAELQLLWVHDLGIGNAASVAISDDGRYILFNRYQYSDQGIPNNRRTVELWVYDRIEDD